MRVSLSPLAHSFFERLFLVVDVPEQRSFVPISLHYASVATDTPINAGEQSCFCKCDRQSSEL